MARIALRVCSCLIVAAVIIRALFDWSADPDLWGHLYFGFRIIGNGPDKFDTSSFTAFGHPVIDHEWLAESALAALYLVIGPEGAGWFKTILAALIIRLIWGGLKAVPILPRTLFTALLVTVLTPGLAMRPQLFTYLFIVWLAIRLSRAQAPKPLELLLLFALWANLHAGWVFGLGMVGAFAVSASHQRIISRASIVSAAILGTLLNPYGYHLWEYVFSELTNPVSREALAEWTPFDFQLREGAFFLLFLIFILGAAAERKAVTIQQVLILIASSALGFLSIRHTPILAVANIPLAALIGSNLARRWNVKLSAPSVAILSAACLGAGVFVIAGSIPAFQLDLGEDTYPLLSLSWMKENRVCKNVWVPLHWGGITLFHLGPWTRVSIDGRWATVYPREVMKENLDFEFSSEGGKWKEILQAHKADCALIELSHPAVQEMHSDKDWSFAVHERDGALLVRNDLLASTTKFDRATASAVNPFVR